MWPTVEMYLKDMSKIWSHFVLMGGHGKHSSSESDFGLPESEKWKYFSFLVPHDL